MGKTLRVLIIEDSEDDALLLLREIERGSYEVEFERVETANAMQSALTQKEWDLIISDYTLPTFNAPQALEVLKASSLDLPFIIISGTIGEESAVTALKAGAHDFLIKGNFARLIPAIERELREAEIRRERKQAQNALKSSETRYRLAARATNDVIWEWDPQTNELIWSENAQSIFGYTSEEMGVEATWWDEHIHPEDRERVITDLSALIESGSTIWADEYRFLRRDGSVAYIVDRGYLERDEEGKPLRIIGAMSDVTKRKQAEEALQEKEHLLSEAQRIGHVGSWSYDIPSDTLKYSDEMYRLLDLPPQEFQHNRGGFLSLTYSIDRPEVAKWMEAITAGRQVQELDFRVFRRNGELRYIQCRGAVVFDTGKPARFIGTAQDITERKLAEIQIRQQIERLNALRKIDQAITSSFNLRSTMDLILSQVITQLQVNAADVLLLDPDGQMLEYAAGKGFRTNVVETVPLRPDESHAGRAVKERRPVYIQNLRDQPDNPLLTILLAAEDFVCYYGVPLIAKGKVKGVLEVFHRVPLQPYPEWLDFLNTLARQAAIATENANLFENLQRSNRELIEAYDATIEGWSRALDLRDKETEGHTLRVTEMTLVLARKFGFTDEHLEDIRWGALLHDIGKMGVPDNILLKPEKLTEDEWLSMKKHPVFAFEMLSPIAHLKTSLDIPYCHHEKWDGTGYPRGLKGEEIPLVARLFAVVDVWDALRSDRPYRKAWPAERTNEYIRTQSGSHFDPKVVDYFLDVIKN